MAKIWELYRKINRPLAIIGLIHWVHGEVTTFAISPADVRRLLPGCPWTVACFHASMLHFCDLNPLVSVYSDGKAWADKEQRNGYRN